MKSPVAGSGAVTKADADAGNTASIHAATIRISPGATSTYATWTLAHGSIRTRRRRRPKWQNERVIVLGRKSRLFAGFDRGVGSAAAMYSLNSSGYFLYLKLTLSLVRKDFTSPL